jgi:integrase
LDITTEVVTRYIQERLAVGGAPATVRNEVAVLGRGFTLAVRAGRLSHRPYLPLPRVSNARTGFFTDEQLNTLLTHLPNYLKPFVEAANITGWRRGELRNLRWPQVDWESGELRLERGTTKSGEPRSFPFAEHPRLAELLREQRRRTSEFESENGAVCPWVFHRKGSQLKWHYHAWIVACVKAGLAGRRLHDLRRSAVRNLIRAGVSEQVAMLITGHKTRSVFDRYHIVSSSDRIEAVRKLAAFHGASERGRGEVVAIEHLREEAQNEHNPRSKASHASARR